MTELSQPGTALAEKEEDIILQNTKKVATENKKSVQPCRVPIVRQMSHRGVTDAHFSQLTNLQHLCVDVETKIRSGISNLTNLTHIETDMYYNIDLIDETLPHLTKLVSLQLGKAGCYQADRLDNRYYRWEASTAISDESLGLLTNLTSLTLTCPGKITGKSLMKLAQLTQLSCCRNTRFKDEELAVLTRLRTLHLSGCTGIEGHGLGTLTNLTFLDISQIPLLTDDCLQNLYRLETLEILGNPKITSAGLAYLPSLKKVAVSFNSNLRQMMENFPELTFI